MRLTCLILWILRTCIVASIHIIPAMQMVTRTHTHHPPAALIIFHLATWRISRCKKLSILGISRVLQISYMASEILLWMTPCLGCLRRLSDACRTLLVMTLPSLLLGTLDLQSNYLWTV